MITPEWIARFEAAGAQRASLRWLRSRPRTLDDLCAKHPDWALWACQIDGWADVLGHVRLDWCAEQAQRAALEYAAARLSPERLDWCAEQAPWNALQYAAALLSAERRARCEEVTR